MKQKIFNIIASISMVMTMFIGSFASVYASEDVLPNIVYPTYDVIKYPYHATVRITSGYGFLVSDQPIFISKSRNISKNSDGNLLLVGFDRVGNNNTIDFSRSTFQSIGGFVFYPNNDPYLIFNTNHDIYNVNDDGSKDLVYKGTEVDPTPPPVTPDFPLMEILGNVFQTIIRMLGMVIGGMICLLACYLLLKQLATWLRRLLRV